jgi:O-antigen/teichoic acid export membrane protein
MLDRLTGKRRAFRPFADTPGEMPARRRDRRIALAAGAGTFQLLVQAAGGLLVIPIVLRALGLRQFGVWGAATSLIWLSGILDIGIGPALVTLVARSTALQRADETRDHVMGALAMGIGLTLFLLALGPAALLAALPRAIVGPYLVAAVGLALALPLNAASNIWMGLQKGYVSGFWGMTQTVMTVTGLLAAAAFSHDVRVYVAVVYGGMVVTGLGCMTHLFISHPELRPRTLAVPMKAITGVAEKGVLFFILSLSASLSYLLDNVLAMWLLGPKASAEMAVALRVCLTSFGLLCVISQPLWPAFAEAAQKRDGQWIMRRLLRGSTALVGAAAAGGAVLMAFGAPLLRWWLRADLHIGAGLLAAMAAWILVQSVFRLPLLLLNGLSILRFQVVICFTGALSAFGLKFLLAPRLGVAGILWSTTITALIIVVPALAWRVHRWLKDFKTQERSVVPDGSVSLAGRL